MGLKSNFAKIVNTSLSYVGLEIRRVQARRNGSIAEIQARMQPRVKLQQLMDHLIALDFHPETVIDVGVGDEGTDWLDSYYPEARRLYVEPLIEFKDAIKQKCDGHSSHYVIAAAGAAAGELVVTFDPIHPTNASILPDGGVSRHVSRTVPVVTLDCLFEEFRLEGPTLLKIDVQGGELEVLKGAEKVLKLTEFVVLEVTLFAVRKGWPLFDEVLAFMKTNGFTVYDILGGSNRPLDGARFQFDIAFVKDTGFFRRSDIWATPGQIEVLRGK